MSKRIQSTLRYRIIKKGSDESSEPESESESENGSEGYVSEGGGKYKYDSLVDSNYKKPKSGSRQDNLTKEQIRQKLKGYRALKTPSEKEYLLNLKPFKVWVRYFNNVTKEFRVGGLLKMVDKELRYIMLVNTSKNLTWSVQLKDCIIFIPKEEEKQKEQSTKEKLYKLYQNGKLSRK